MERALARGGGDPERLIAIPLSQGTSRTEIARGLRISIYSVDGLLSELRAELLEQLNGGR